MAAAAMWLDEAPLLYYDLWTVALSFLDRGHWVGIANTAPSLDDVVVYHALELGLTPWALLAMMNGSRNTMQAGLRWHTTLEPTNSVCLNHCLRNACVPGSVTAHLPVSLDIGGCSCLSDEAVGDIIGTLARYGTSLDDISLRALRETDSGRTRGTTLSKALVTTMATAFPKLVSLCVCGQDEFTNDAIVLLASHAPHLERLYVADCRLLTDLSPLHTLPLHRLDISRDCAVGTWGLRRLKSLHTLEASYNVNVYSLNCLPQLQDVSAGGCCGVDQDGIARLLDVQKLDVFANPRVKSVNHMKRLRSLQAGGMCGISSAGFADVAASLRHLSVRNNGRVDDVNACVHLDSLDVSGSCCGVGMAGIRSLDGKLSELIAYDNHLLDNWLSTFRLRP